MSADDTTTTATKNLNALGYPKLVPKSPVPSDIAISQSIVQDVGLLPLDELAQQYVPLLFAGRREEYTQVCRLDHTQSLSHTHLVVSLFLLLLLYSILFYSILSLDWAWNRTR